MTHEAVNAVWLDGVQLDIIGGDISDFERRVRELIEQGGGWLFYSQPYVNYQLHVTSTSSVIIRYAR